MRFSTLFLAASLAISSVSATPRPLAARNVIDDLSADHSYGAPIPPWKQGCRPGWYNGNSQNDYPDIPWLSGLICELLELFPFLLQCPAPTPPPSDGYHSTFTGLTGATEASDYLTYGLVDTVDDCKAMCSSVPGCAFVNTYHDVNGKGGSTQLTCSLFSQCHTASDATNTGGQTQPDGNVDYITDSAGYCKT